MNKLLIPITLFPILLVGCKKSEYVPQKPTITTKTSQLSSLKPEQMFPFKVGNSWVYLIDIVRAEEGKPEVRGSAEFTYTVVSVTNPSEGVTRGTIEVSDGIKSKDRQVWESDSGGLYQVSVGLDPINFSPRQQIIKFPIKPEETYKFSGTGVGPSGGSATLNYEFAMHDMQPVDTESGSMSGFFVESSGTFKGSRGEGIVGNNSWFVPDVGLARFKQVIRDKTGSTAITLRLKSYNIKK